MFRVQIDIQTKHHDTTCARAAQQHCERIKFIHADIQHTRRKKMWALKLAKWWKKARNRLDWKNKCCSLAQSDFNSQPVRLCFKNDSCRGVMSNKIYLTDWINKKYIIYRRGKKNWSAKIVCGVWMTMLKN